MSDSLVDLSRLQFAVTAMYHFLFVPLTLGMTWILVVMESVYVMTNKTVYKDMTRFWGKLFGINFALGVTTGLTLEFQFGTNWAYYSHYVGDIFGAPLAIEGLMAFFLESTFIGLFFFGWERLSKPKHLLVTILMALGTNLSALWILVANGWMQNPVGAAFNPVTMRMELVNFWDVIFNAQAQTKFVHTLSAGYVTGATFVLAVSAWYLLRRRDVEFAKRSFRIASAFGLASVLSVIVLGDESGYTVGEGQQTKMAAIEAIWDTEPAPASLNIVAWPDEAKGRNDWEVSVPWVMGLIGTRSVSKEIPGINQIRELNARRVRSGIEAVKALEAWRRSPSDPAAKAAFEQHQADLGFGLLLKRYVNRVEEATPQQIRQAVDSTIPRVAPMFWSFRVMVGLAFLMLALFVLSFASTVKTNCEAKPWLLKWALWMLPAPWIAAELGWFVAEYGRQPWTIYGALPTHLSVSTLSVASLYGSLAGFIGFYTLLLVVEIFLMVRYARLGPASLGTGRYDGERASAPSGPVSGLAHGAGHA